MPVKHINTDLEFEEAMEAAGGKPAVVFFFDESPFYEQLSNKYPSVQFFQVNIKKCHGRFHGKMESTLIGTMVKKFAVGNEKNEVKSEEMGEEEIDEIEKKRSEECTHKRKFAGYYV
ncbi:hypothetical protein PRIPAC_84414 [Pristionchus pacificus]|uniref:Uncharacterized protein n=1 Tax=Pristionchus pacificus TaxID=54126 RepID=A0A2A6CJ38_PRIPA|nr:hypothetical protein PRIPAC_84414 [Pristionchus pacificus]|eukprot:PDM78031.1 hypothetical protein PRIPAC_35220 [Pristionchus pacificus]